MEKSPQPTEQSTESSASYQEIPAEDFRRIYNVERSDGTIEYGWREEGHGVTEDGLAYTRVIREIDDPRNPGQKVMAEKNVPTDKLLADHEKAIQAKREVSRRMGEAAQALPLLEAGEAPKLITSADVPRALDAGVVERQPEALDLDDPEHVQSASERELLGLLARDEQISNDIDQMVDGLSSDERVALWRGIVGGISVDQSRILDQLRSRKPNLVGDYVSKYREGERIRERIRELSN